MFDFDEILFDSLEVEATSSEWERMALITPPVYEYWDKDKYVEGSAEGQRQLRSSQHSIDCSLKIHRFGTVTIKDFDQVDISNAEFTFLQVEHHVRLQPPKKGDETVNFIYKDFGRSEFPPGKHAAEERRGWQRMSAETNEELRRSYAQEPFPQRFNFFMDRMAYALSDFHRVDDGEAYFQSLDSSGKRGRRVGFNEETVVQKKLCVFAYEGQSKAKLLTVLEEGADINKAAEDQGLTPLGYAVQANHFRTVEDLVSLKADVNLHIREDTTVLTMAFTCVSHDGTEMVRHLLSLGADPNHVDLLEPAARAEVESNVSMRYWLRRATQRPITAERLKRLTDVGLERLPQLEFSVVGQEAAIRYIVQRVQGFYHPPFHGRPLVMLALGPPGHGKTEFTRQLAMAVASEDKLLEISCGMLRDDADLFGSRLGGWSSGKFASKGQLIEFLEKYPKERCVILLDEFEKIRDLTSSLGWAQDQKIYQGFLEPWQEGVITDPGAGEKAGRKIDLKNKIFIATSNIGQDAILKFAAEHLGKLSGEVTQQDISWVQSELVKKKLLPILMNFFAKISPELQALVSRIDCIVPFLPFNEEQRCVVADKELRCFFANYRKAPQTDGPEEDRRPIGNLIVSHTEAVAKLGASTYNHMEGARSMQRMAREVHGKLVDLHLDCTLDDAETVELQGRTFRRVYATACDGAVGITLSPPAQQPIADDDASNPLSEGGDEIELVEEAGSISENTARERPKAPPRRFDRASYDRLPRF